MCPQQILTAGTKPGGLPYLTPLSMTQRILCSFSLLSNLEPSLHPKKYTRVHKKSKQRGLPYTLTLCSKEQTKQISLPVLTILASETQQLFLEANLVASLHGVQAKPNRSVSYWEMMPSIFLFQEFNLHGNFYKTSLKFYPNNKHDQCQT